MVLFVPWLINIFSTFLQQQIQKETPNSNQTINQLLLQDYQPLSTEEPDGESQLHPKIDDALRRQETV